MFLKRIELHGFKSFAGPKDIELGPGVTGIVGPNGSGKSNICDAIRWVLGEQSSRTLRGSSLQDVIFKGTQSRPKRNVCEVSLVFDNEDGKLNLPYSEVSVTRSINRAGDSAFRINGTDCRLRDILVLFQNTGVGRDGYSIIGQGQISNILEHRASERRGVFDEAAGITRLRASKEDAEKNLEKTHANMGRLRDILHELEEQLGPARDQMNRAHSYLSLSGELKRLEVSMLLDDRQAASVRYEQLAKVLDEQEAENNRQNEELEKLTAETDSVAAQLENERVRGRALLDQLGRSGRENERHRGAAALAAQKIDAANERLRQLAQEKTARTESSARLEIELRQVRMLADDTEKTITALQNEAERLQGELEEQNTAEAASIATDISSVRASAAEAEREARELRVAAAGCAAQKKTVEEQLAAAQGQLTQSEEERLLAGRKAKSVRASLEKISAALHISERNLIDARASKNSAAKALEEAVHRHASAAAHADVLAQAQQAYDGYYEGVRRLMRDAASDRELASHITGVIGENIDVPGELETAIEVALGAGLQNVVVPHDSDAKELVHYLRENRYGRVTFLPSNSLRTRLLSCEERCVLNEHGCLCAANEAVACTEQMRPAIDYLLGRTMIVKDLDTALRIKAARRNTFRIVTVQGDTVSTGGAITGGSTDRSRRSFLARRRQAEDAAAEAQRAGEEQERRAEQAREAEALCDALEGALRRVRSELHDVRQRQEALEAEEKQILARTEVQKADVARYTAALSDIAREESALKEHADSAEHRYADFLERVRTSEAKHAQQLEEAAMAAVAKAELESRIARNSAELGGAKNKLRLYTDRTADIDRLIHDSQAAEAAAAELRRTLEEQRSAAQGELNDIARDIERSDEKAQQIRHAGNESAQVELALEQSLKKLENRRRTLSAGERATGEQILRTQAELEKLKESQEQCAERLWSEYQLTLANAEQLRVEDFDRRRGRQRIGEIRNAISELGPVNPQAGEDFRRLNDRAQQYSEQLRDLEKAGKDLEDLLADLLAQMQRIFLERFSLINENFGRIFRELFGGGTAHIELTKDEEIMSAGIEILAEPPGKKLQNLSLLSGGERTLTAIALCLAMLAVNPSPVCILDEIDAPLDDKNALRLAEYLHRVSGTLQFLIITHRKTTMAVCDALYGISMPDHGVSDIVSVRLDQH